jgi:hypothetical protein
MDETGLFWRRQPTHTLTDDVTVSGTKLSKARITAVVCGNADGSDKVELWLIGHVMKPRAFKNINRALLGIHWDASKTAWMNTVIMLRYLKWFNARIAGRKVALVMDGFVPHVNAAEELKGQLQNVQIIILPPNCTSRYQPIDQGVIRAWKAHYKRDMMRFIVNFLDTQPEFTGNVYSEINILHAARWAVDAWKHGVKPSTLENCFRKSTIKVCHIILYLRFDIDNSAATWTCSIIERS